MPRKKKKPERRKMLTVERDPDLDADLDKVRGVTKLTRRHAVKKALWVYRNVLECKWDIVNAETGAEIEIG